MTTYTLYRFFDADGQLLYIGRTVDARSRWRAHEKAKAWFDDVATVTREKHESAEALAQAEADAIAAEHPLHNIQLNWRGRAGDRGDIATVTPEIFTDIYSLPEAAYQLSIGRSTVEKLIHDGALRSVKIGGRRLVPAAALDDFVQRLLGRAS